MAQALKQFHRGTKPPQYLFEVPHPTGRKTVSGTEIYESDWFVKEAAGLNHPGLTQREVEAQRMRKMKVWELAVGILFAVAVCAGLWISL